MRPRRFQDAVQCKGLVVGLREAAAQAKEEDHFCDDDSSTDSGDFEARLTAGSKS